MHTDLLKVWDTCSSCVVSVSTCVKYDTSSSCPFLPNFHDLLLNSGIILDDLPGLVIVSDNAINNCDKVTGHDCPAIPFNWQEGCHLITPVAEISFLVVTIFVCDQKTECTLYYLL